MRPSSRLNLAAEPCAATMSAPAALMSAPRPTTYVVRPPEGDEQSKQVTFAHERPQADDIRRPPPEGDEQSKQVTFALKEMWLGHFP